MPVLSVPLCRVRRCPASQPDDECESSAASSGSARVPKCARPTDT